MGGKKRTTHPVWQLSDPPGMPTTLGSKHRDPPQLRTCQRGEDDVRCRRRIGGTGKWDHVQLVLLGVPESGLSVLGPRDGESPSEDEPS